MKNIRLKLKNWLTPVVITCVVVFIVWLPVSCRITESGIEIVTGDLTMPKIVSWSVMDNTSIELVCSEAFSLKDLIIRSEDDITASEIDDVFYENNDFKAYLHLPEPTVPGTNYFLTGKVLDENGNSLMFSLPVAGFNQRPPRLLLSEIRTKHSSSGGLIKKAEYVELYVLKGGNTAGLELLSGSDGDEKKYVFPMIEVNAGDYITVHFRTTSDGDCVDELEEDITLSTGEGSCSSARDLWVDNTETRISDSDVIVVRDSCRDLLVDCVMFSASGKSSWFYGGQKALAAEACESGLWKGESGPQNSVCSDGITAIRTLCRQNIDELIEKYKTEELTADTLISAGKEDWSLEVKGTPGERNSGELYVK